MYENEIVLEQQIETLRSQLKELVADKGFTHCETIVTSQKLDELLNNYNKK